MFPVIIYHSLDAPNIPRINIHTLGSPISCRYRLQQRLFLIQNRHITDGAMFDEGPLLQLSDRPHGHRAQFQEKLLRLASTLKSQNSLTKEGKRRRYGGLFEILK